MSSKYNKCSSSGNTKCSSSGNTKCSSSSGSKCLSILESCSSSSDDCSSNSNSSDKYCKIVNQLPCGAIDTCNTNQCGDYSCFKAIISPAINVTSLYTASIGYTTVKMIKQGKIVTLSFEGFSGQISATGVTYLTLNQSIYNLPQFPTQIPYRIIYNSIATISFIQIDPTSTDNVQLYLNVSNSGLNINIGDSFIVPSTTISWMSNC